MPSPTAEDEGGPAVRRRGWRSPKAIVPAVIAAAAAVIVTMVIVGSDEPVGTDGEPLPTDPEEAVERFLHALQTSDAELALQFLTQSTWDTVPVAEYPELSRKVLAESNHIAQLGDVAVGTADEISRDTYEVPASFSIGGETVQRTFEVRVDDIALIQDGLITVSSDPFTGSGLMVNGEPTSSNPVSLFPGAYVFDAKLDAFELDGVEQPMTLAADDDVGRFERLSPELTDDATATFRALVRKSLDECLASDRIDAACGLKPTSTASDDPAGFVENTVRREIAPDARSELVAAIADLNLVRSPDQPGVFELPLELDPDDVTVTVSSEKNGDRTRGPAPKASDLKTPSVDFGRVAPRVTWK